MDSRDISQAVAATMRMLEPHASADWQRPAGPLTWTCHQTAAHIAHDLMAYACQLAARRTTRYLPVDLVARAECSPRDLLDAIAAMAHLLGTTVDSSDGTARAWHWGPTDPGGFAALGVTEILVHTHDITAGLGLTWDPPEALCSAVLARMFPDAPGGDPARVLLWSTGRADLPGHPRPHSWVSRAALPR